MKAEEVGPTDVVQVVVHGAFLPQLREWLTRQGMLLQPQPWPDPDDGLPTFFIQPGPERMAMIQHLETRGD